MTRVLPLSFMSCISVAALWLAAATPSLADINVSELRPSHADPRVKDFDETSLILNNRAAPAGAPLVLFLPGTGGQPSNATDFLTIVAKQGYRVIGLEYDDTPAVSQVCPQNPDPDCSTAFRKMRVEGEGTAVVSNPASESIDTRLAAALTTLNRSAPNDGWDQYLDGEQPRWDRIIVSGLSQGAGMAAWIAKHHLVARVVLFSSPWDVTGPDHHPAPWLSEPSATPPERWFAEYHARENTARLITNAYTALNIPADHIQVFNQDLPPDFHGNSPNPFHVNTIRDMRYKSQWQLMFGKGADYANQPAKY